MPTLLKPAAWGAHLLMLVMVAIALGMGMWQWSVWHDDRTAAQRDLTNADPVALSSLMGADSPFPGDKVGHPVTLEGRWLDRDTVFVSHKRHAGRTGFWAVTPVAIGDSAIPVVRGWSPRATAPPVSGNVGVTGWLEPSEPSGRADVRPSDAVITSMRIASMTQHVHTDLYSGFVIARKVSGVSTGSTSGDRAAGLARVGPTEQPDVSGFTGLRNLLYSLQWWVFIVLIVYVWWRWCQDQLHPPRQDPEPDGAEPVDNLTP